MSLYFLFDQRKDINEQISHMIRSCINFNKPILNLDKCKLININKTEIKGITYYCTLNDIPLLLKIIPCEKDKLFDNSMIEITYIKLFNEELLLTMKNPNIPYMYYSYQGLNNNSKCFKHVPYKILSKITSIEPFSNILLCEYYPDKDIDLWTETHDYRLNEEHWKSIIFQVIITLAILQDKYHFMHNDLHPGNILIDNILPDKDFEYKFYDKTYYVRNLGYIAKLWDFEFSNLFHPNYSSFKNPVISDINYNQSYDLHNFLKGLLTIDILPENIVNFIESLYPHELLYISNNNCKEIRKVNTSNNNSLLIEGVLTPYAADQYPKLPIPSDLINHHYFINYNNTHCSYNTTNNLYKFHYP